MAEQYERFAQIPPASHLVTIGTFDGVHLGHRALLDSARRRALELSIPLLVVTFEPNPGQVVRPEAFRGRLLSPADKVAHLHAAGAPSILALPFTESLMRETPEQFMNDVAHATHPVEVWVGEAFALGHGRRGDTSRLTEIGRDLGYALVAIARLELDGEIVSSSRIRTLVLAGDVETANRLLGYRYRLSGTVIRGAQIGRTIGFPTANVEPPTDLVALPDGIYAAFASGDGVGDRLPAIAYIGTRPALNTGSRQIETHILDFTDDIYGRTLHTDFVQRLRPDSDFPSVDALVAQLHRDEALARQALLSSD